MGKLILCSGERTTRPYGFPPSGIRMYSIEELCYYLYHNVYMIEEDMLSEDLFSWIGTELKLEERAEKLRLLKRQKADIKILITVILCSADYYTEEEIKAVLKVLDAVTGMPVVKRYLVKANHYLKNGQYMEAMAEYERIIASKAAAELTPEEYGDVYHNLAVAKLHITGLKEASKLFCYAYERNKREESLTQYLYTRMLCNGDSSPGDIRPEYRTGEEDWAASEEVDWSADEDMNRPAGGDMNWPAGENMDWTADENMGDWPGGGEPEPADRALRKRALDFFRQKAQEIQASEQLQRLEELKQKRERGEQEEFYQEVDRMLEAWKNKIRQM